MQAIKKDKIKEYKIEEDKIRKIKELHYSLNFYDMAVKKRKKRNREER